MSVNTIIARDLRVGDFFKRHNERHFVELKAIDYAYPGAQHFGQGEDDTVQVDVGWGKGYFHPDEEVEVLRINTVEDLIAYANEHELGRGFA